MKLNAWRVLQRYTLPQIWWKDRLLWSAILIAVAVHAIVLSIHFATDNGQSGSNQDITIAVRLSKDPVKDSKFLAQEHQRGGGDVQQDIARTTPLPFSEQESSVGEQDQSQLKVPQEAKAQNQERVLMTILSWQKLRQDEGQEKEAQQIESRRQQRAAMIASIEAQFAQRQQMYAKQQKIKTVTGIEAKKDASAAYLDRFRQKVEMFGNRYYPEAAKQQDLSGDVRLMVILNARGGLRAIHLLQSSGNPILDEAAKDSVRRAMPFGPFDKGMEEISELRIVRTWRFDADNSAFAVN